MMASTQSGCLAGAGQLLLNGAALLEAGPGLVGVAAVGDPELVPAVVVELLAGSDFTLKKHSITRSF